MGNKIIYKPFGKRAILIEWKPIINEVILANILAFKTKIRTAHKANVIDIFQGYNSLTIIYQIDIDFTKEVNLLQSIYTSPLETVNQKFYHWEIPVCYDLKFGIDLNEIANYKNLSVDQIIKLHSEAVYKVYFIGFLPGFLYLGGLHQQLFVDRKPKPRLEVAKGSVAIGGKQTGVYPNKSPGGWNIIGKTPINFFDVDKDSPCFAKAGDTLKFKPISLNEYYQIEKELHHQIYQFVKTVQHA